MCARVAERRKLKMTETYEVKVRFAGDFRPWEEIPLQDTITTSETLDEVKRGACAYFRLFRPGAIEIRINCKGSLQGHYSRV